MKVKDEPNKVTATLKVVVTGEFYGDEASEETLRYCVEQDLEDAGFDVDVALLREQPKWISVKDRMPIETHSIFWRFSGTDKWSNAMWREQSDKVLVTVVFKDGTRLVTTGETHDGKWNTSISRTLEHTVTHWMQFPELPREGAKE